VDKHEVVEADPAALAGAGAGVLSDRLALGKIANQGFSEKAARAGAFGLSPPALVTGHGVA
jgi:hypothetical protein